MRLSGLVVGGIFSVLALTSAAQAADGFYVSGSLGAYVRDDVNSRVSAIDNPAITGSFRRVFDPGVAANIALGYHLPFRFRVEAELGYTEIALSKEVAGPPFNTITPYSSGADQHRYNGTLNLFYDLPFGDLAVPYIGGGIGGTHAESSSADSIDNLGRPKHFAGGNTNRGLGLVEGGFNIALNEHLILVPSYRWIRYFGGPGLGDTEAGSVFKIGLRYEF